MFSYLKYNIFLLVKFFVETLNVFLIRLHIWRYGNNDKICMVYSVIWRYKPAENLDFSSKDDFISIFYSSCHSKELLKDNISLYCINTTEAFLVDCENEDIFDSKHHAFAYNAQFGLAKKVISIPIETFHKLSLELTLPNIPMIHLANHGRCGSTLLSKMFEAIPGALSISETNAFTNLASISQQGLLSRSELKKMCYSLIMFTIKHCLTRKSKVLCLKFQNVVLYVTDLMMESVPEIKTLYMYRQPTAFVRSYEKLLFANNWDPLSVKMAIFWSGIGFNELLKDTPVYDHKKVASLSSFSRFSLIWITSHAAFFKLLAKGYLLKSLKFEDFLKDPRKTISGIFEYVDLPEYLMPDVDEVMSRDSQAGTEYSSRSVDKKKMDASFTPITHALTEELDEMCNQFNCPLFWNDIHLDHSII